MRAIVNTLDPAAVFQPPCITADLPGTGGALKVEPEDFVVEEIADGEPSGSGPFLLLWIEKRGLPADALVQQLAGELDVDVDQIGVAGLKDTHAVTRQWVSVPAFCESRLQNVGGAVRVLRSERHYKALRAGYLRGNRFDILVRDPARCDAAGAVLEALARTGVPNYFGPQRFGHGASTLLRGLALLRGEAGGMSKFMRRLTLSAVQSALFNIYLTERLRLGQFGSLLDGDVVWERKLDICKWATPADQAQYDRRAVLPTGPIFGMRMRWPHRAALELERSILQRTGLTEEAFEPHHRIANGSRRPIAVFPEDVQLRPDDSGLRIAFTLPAGAYATVVLREIMKNEGAPRAES